MIEVSTAHPGVRMTLFEAWRDPAVVKVAQEAGLQPNHANWSEAFEFTRVGPMPEGVKPTVEFSRTASAAETRAALGDGSYGGPYSAPAEVMERTFKAAVESMVALLRAI
jgi:creatinine amidohydrolase